MSPYLASVSEQLMSIMGSSAGLESTCDEFFAYLRTLFPLREMCLGFFQPELKRSFLLSVTTCQGTKAHYSYSTFTKEQQAYISQCDFFSTPIDKLVTDPEDPMAKVMGSAGFQVPFVQTRCVHHYLPYGAGTFMLEGEANFAPDILDIARSTMLPLNIFINERFRFWELNQLNQMVSEENSRLRRKAMGLPVDAGLDIIGASGGLRESVGRLTQVAPLDVNLLLSGETGTGKEVFARAAHMLSSRRKGPLVAVNCGAIPPTLIDNELFGHSKGAYTGAVETHRGRFEHANQGTLFLDEIGELPLEVQARLLRVLETRIIERLGGHEQIPVNFRLIAATHRNLSEMVEKGEFRKDLFYRLAVVSIHIPPLRERRQDIPLLAYAFMKTTIRRFNLAPDSLLIPQDQMQRLLHHTWPGNVRELQNVVEEAVALCTNGRLSFPQLSDAPKKILESPPPPPVASPKEGTQTSFLSFDDMVRLHLQEALRRCAGKIQGKGSAAQLLGLHPNTLRTKLEKYGIGK